MTTPGYSGKPLIEKLGLKPEMLAVALDAPDDYPSLLATDLPILRSLGEGRPHFVHVFATERAILERHLENLYHRIDSNGMVWVSWPKKSANVLTDIDENVIRDICLPIGWVDVKVCAVSHVWSGLKLVIRRELRPKK